jgi:hypothetical protein
VASRYPSLKVLNVVRSAAPEWVAMLNVKARLQLLAASALTPAFCPIEYLQPLLFGKRLARVDFDRFSVHVSRTSIP